MGEELMLWLFCNVEELDQCLVFFTMIEDERYASDVLCWGSVVGWDIERGTRFVFGDVPRG